jgi:hypothetical protein
MPIQEQMNTRFVRNFLSFLFVGVCLLAPRLTILLADTPPTQNVILITLDGVRTEEMFGGADLEILRSMAKNTPVEQTPLYEKYWADTPEARRSKLMPFFWGTWMAQQGSIIGNRAKGSEARLANRHRFSYPGYSELLTGQARDNVIKSNDKRQNPFPTVLEFLREELFLTKMQVAAFCSWDVFDYIVESKPGTITVNSGFSNYADSSPEIQALNQLQMETRTPWDNVRHDAYTFRFAMAHLKTHRPRVLYLALGETDDWGHDKRYDRVLQALEMTDGYLQDLWAFLQSHDQYRDRTTLVITTDHGRGTNEFSWPNHGAQIEGAQYIWLAVVSPDLKRRGEWENTETVYLNQVASTLCRFLGVDYSKHDPKAGNAIRWLFEP